MRRAFAETVVVWKNIFFQDYDYDQSLANIQKYCEEGVVYVFGIVLVCGIIRFCCRAVRMRTRK